jgi:hypothetical protein
MRSSDSYLHWDASAHSAVEILRRARDLVAFGWCQRVDATDAEHRPTRLWSSRARDLNRTHAEVVEMLSAAHRRGEALYRNCRP